MPNGVQKYIYSRIEAGDSAEEIAARLHGWGWRLNDQKAPSRMQYSSSESASSPRVGSSFLIGLSALLLIGLGSGSWFLFEAEKSWDSEGQQSLRSENRPEVLAAQTDTPSEPAEQSGSIAPIASDSAKTASGSASASNSAQLAVAKQEYSLVLIGDSMLDTLNDSIPEFKDLLEQKYAAKFTIYNYAVGSQNVEMALETFGQPLSYQDRTLPGLDELQPDIIIINSFAYNPFDPHDVDRHWIALATLIDRARGYTDQVYLLADAAPLRDRFGMNTLTWPVKNRIAHAENIKSLLLSTRRLAESMNVQLVDVYAETSSPTGFGIEEYTDATDGIHLSEEGKTKTIELLTSQLLLEEVTTSDQ